MYARRQFPDYKVVRFRNNLVTKPQCRYPHLDGSGANYTFQTRESKTVCVKRWYSKYMCEFLSSEVIREDS